jgi:hypothetical protein
MCSLNFIRVCNKRFITTITNRNIKWINNHAINNISISIILKIFFLENGIGKILLHDWIFFHLFINKSSFIFTTRRTSYYMLKMWIKFLTTTLKIKFLGKMPLTMLMECCMKSSEEEMLGGKDLYHSHASLSNEYMNIFMHDIPLMHKFLKLKKMLCWMIIFTLFKFEKAVSPLIYSI